MLSSPPAIPPFVSLPAQAAQAKEAIVGKHDEQHIPSAGDQEGPASSVLLGGDRPAGVPPTAGGLHAGREGGTVSVSARETATAVGGGAPTGATAFESQAVEHPGSWGDLVRSAPGRRRRSLCFVTDT